MNIKWLTFMAVVMCAAMVTAVVPAKQQDSDGTRLQARPVDLGTVHTDRLDPPGEEADWRMVQLEERHTLQLQLDIRTGGRNATLTLTDAAGEPIADDTAGDQSADIEEQLEAGIYYIAVESTESLTYELRID